MLRLATTVAVIVAVLTGCESAEDTGHCTVWQPVPVGKVTVMVCTVWSGP